MSVRQRVTWRCWNALEVRDWSRRQACMRAGEVVQGPGGTRVRARGGNPGSLSC